jgi:hypothetical protein
MEIHPDLLPVHLQALHVWLESSYVILFVAGAGPRWVEACDCRWKAPPVLIYVLLPPGYTYLEQCDILPATLMPYYRLRYVYIRVTWWILVRYVVFVDCSRHCGRLPFSAGRYGGGLPHTAHLFHTFVPVYICRGNSFPVRFTR